MTRAKLGELLLRNMTLIIFIVVFVYFGVQAPRFFGIDSIANIIKQASFIGIIAVGMTFVLLTAGIDLSVGSNMYLSAMAAGYLMQNPAFQNGPGVAAAIFVGLLAGTAFGALNAFCIVVLRITPFLVTLATMVAGRGLGTAITESFGIEFPAPYLAFGASNLLGVPMPIVAFVIVVASALLSFFPIWFLHPVRVKRLRPLNLAVFVIWAVLSGVALLKHFESPAWVVWGVVATGLYLYCIGFVLQIFPQLGRKD